MAALAGQLLGHAAEPLDRVRTALYKLSARVPPLRRLMGKRDQRVAFVATAHALVAFTFAVALPTFLLAIGPVLLGVAHVVADLRYLVLRRGLPRVWLAIIAAACVTLIALRGADEIGLGRLAVARAEHGVVTAWIAVALGFGAATSRRWGRVALGFAVLSGLAVVAQTHPYQTRLVYAHLHNVVALVLWLALFRSRLRAAAIPLAVIVLMTLLLSSGRTYFITERLGTTDVFGLHVLAAADWLAPGLSFYPAVGLTLSFAFLQSVHYSTWLLVIPQEDVPGPGTSTYRRFARALLREFGQAGVALIVIGTFGVVVLGFFGLARARNLYLSLAMFHGYVELALGAYFFTRGGFAPLARSAPAVTARLAA